MASVKDLKIHVHAPDGTSTSAEAPPNYKTDQFLKEIVSALGLPATADWSVHDADINRNLDKDKTLEENGVREGHHLHLRERARDSGPSPEPARPPEPSRQTGQKKAAVGESDPVVGWLVCITGTQRGKDYKIRSGNNTIGRSTEMHICISGDDAISRDRHAVISFDPQTTSFHLMPGEGRGLAYVNDMAVLGAAKLQPYDEIRLGDTKVIFVPFCGEKFIWTKNAD